MANLIGEQLGDFRIVRELGRGGMGVVYEAQQISLNRKVALKVVGAGFGLSSQAVVRFQREAEAAAKLHHTNIVPVYATGQQNDLHFYAMELIDGPSLDLVIKNLRTGASTDEGPLPAALTATAPYLPNAAPSGVLTASSLGSGTMQFDTIARMIADVADALEHAHKNGVVHRDIKPSNLLLSPEGKLSINDFGLARLLEQPGMTTTGEFVGTPAYMSPEQITAGRVPIDQRTDIYSLGATLYELLTLRPPFPGDRRDQVLAQIVQKDPLPPRRINKSIPVDLETICLKCLEKDPDRRYPNGKELAEDLRRHLNRFAIMARRPGPLVRLNKWVKRNPLVAAAALVVFMAMGAAGFFGYRSYQSDRRAEEARKRHEGEIRAERRRAALERAVVCSMSGDFDGANKALDDAVTNAASAAEVRFLRGQIALHRGQTEEAIAHLEEAVRLAPEWPAAQAALLRAFADAGRMDEFYGRLSNVLKLRDRLPGTADDYLYLGQVTAYESSEQGLVLLDRAIEMRDSVLARLARAEVRVGRAMDTGTIADAEAATTDATRARATLPGNPIALAVSLEAHLTAANAYRRHERDDDAKQAFRQAARDADELKAYPHVPSAVRARGWFLDLMDDDDGLRAEYVRDRDATGGAIAGRPYFFLLYRGGKFTQALEVLDRMPHTGNEVMYHVRRGLTLANLPDGDARAMAEYRALLDEINKGRGSTRSGYARFIVQLLGRQAEALQFYRNPKMPSGFGHAKQWRQYSMGELTAQELLAVAGPSLFYQCEAHFWIGISLLADGDRAGARAHFEKSVATGVFRFLEHEWSRAFLARMDADKNWPSWIKNTKEFTGKEGAK